MVVGATGNIGSIILEALLDHNHFHDEDMFAITALTRNTSLSKVLKQYSHSLGSAAFPHAAHIQVASVRSYTDVAAVANILEQYEIEVVICAIAALSVNDQKYLIDACIAAPTVRRFFPSEYSVDTSSRNSIEQYLPSSVLKIEVIDHLRRASAQTHGRLSWTAIITGSLLDLALSRPDVTVFDLKAMAATVFDGGGTKYEGTTSLQLGRTIIAILSSKNSLRTTADQYVFVNSFTVTQSQIIELVEKHTQQSFAQEPAKTRELFDDGKSIMDSRGGLDAYRAFQPHGNRPYPRGVPEIILAATYGGQAFGGLNQYSLRNGELWNERLNLPMENLDEAIKSIVQILGRFKEPTEV